jgi:hypothetical protein
VYFFALSFLGVYLVTRLYLTFALQNTLALLTGVRVEGVQVIDGSLAEGQVGTQYSQTLASKGGTSPLTWFVTPPLPAGLTLNSSNGVIAGTPTVASPARNYVFTVVDSGAPPEAARRAFKLQVN